PPHSALQFVTHAAPGAHSNAPASHASQLGTRVVPQRQPDGDVPSVWPPASWRPPPSLGLPVSLPERPPSVRPPFRSNAPKPAPPASARSTHIPARDARMHCLLTRPHSHQTRAPRPHAPTRPQVARMTSRRLVKVGPILRVCCAHSFWPQALSDWRSHSPLRAG